MPAIRALSKPLRPSAVKAFRRKTRSYPRVLKSGGSTHWFPLRKSPVRLQTRWQSLSLWPVRLRHPMGRGRPIHHVTKHTLEETKWMRQETKRLTELNPPPGAAIAFQEVV